MAEFAFLKDGTPVGGNTIGSLVQDKDLITTLLHAMTNESLMFNGIGKL